MAYDGPVAYQSEDDRTCQQKGNIDEGVRKYKRESGIQSVLRLTIIGSTLLQNYDRVSKTGYYFERRVGGLHEGIPATDICIDTCSMG